MAIPVMNFPMLSFEQANPALEGVQRGVRIVGDTLSNQKAQAALPYTQPMLEEALRQAQYQTQMDAPKAKYAEKITLADLLAKQEEARKTQLANQYYPEETEADIAYKQAQTKYIPLNALLNIAGKMNTSSRFGDAYQLSRTLTSMPEAQRATWIAQNQSAYNDMLNTLGNKALQQEVSPIEKILGSALQQYFPDMAANLPQQQGQQVPLQDRLGGMQPQPQQAPSPVQDQLASLQQQATGGQPTGAPTMAQPTAAPRFASTKEQTEQLQAAGELIANKKLTGTAMNGRAEAAVALEKWLMDNRETYVPRINNALDYSGVKGAVQRKKDQSLAAMGLTPSSGYTDMVWATNDFRTALVNQIKMMEKMGATNEQREEMHNLLSAIDNITLNPKSAKELFNKSMRTFSDLSDAVIGAAEPVNKGAYRKAYQVPKLEENYLDIGEKKKAATATPQGMVEIIASDGKHWNIPQDKLDAAIKRGAKKVG
jgi:hypothetical protein